MPLEPDIARIRTEPVCGPTAWTGDDISGNVDWIYRFHERGLEEIDAALRNIRSSGLSFANLEKADFPVPTLEKDLRAIAFELENGRGFVQMKGLPVERYDTKEAQVVYWGLGLHLGTAISQNSRGDLLGHVRDEGLDINDTNVRGYQTNAGQSFHTDIGGDVVGLMCLHGSKAGGRSRIASSVTIYNEMLSRYPWYVGLLYKSFDIDWRGEQPAGSAPTYREPVYAYFDGKLSCRFMPRFIMSAQTKTGQSLSGVERDALAMVEQLAEQVCVEISFEPGDIQLINNYVMLHGRTGYEDHADPARKRHLLRLWLRVAGARRLPPEYGGGRAHTGVPVKAQSSTAVAQW